MVSESSIKKVVKEVEEIVGDKGLNCLINNAGINVLASLEEVTAETMLTIYETNTVAQLMVTKVGMGLTWGFSIAELDLCRGLSPWNCTETVLMWSCLSGEQPELLFVQLLWDPLCKVGLGVGRRGCWRKVSIPLLCSEEPSPPCAGGTQLL